uniref:PAS domain-containing protein n=1 Tax=Arcella intermedia TaxID=1963864 RepID=A0A6B2LGS9_9EUKA
MNATIVIDTNGIIRFLNQATENITGYTRTDLLGSNVSVLMSQELAAKHDGFIKRHLETGVNHIIGIGRNVEMMVKDGTLIKVHLEVTEHKNQADGKYFIGSLSVAKDKDLESLLEKERAVLGGLAVPVFIITEDGLIKALNPSAEKEFGYPESKIVGKNINILMIKEHARKHNTYIQNYLATGKAKIIGKSRVVPVKCKDGKVKNCHLSVSVKKHDNVRIFVGMLVVLGN